MSNTGNSLAIVERNLQPMMPRFEAMVTPVGLDARRFMHSILFACERNPRLLDYPVQQHVQIASTCSTLGLEPDGVSGQMFLIPFGGRNPVIQTVIGYKGFNTTAARAGIVIHGDVLREGDRFSLELVAGRPYAVDTSATFGRRHDAPIIGAWAQAETPSGFSTPVVMDMSEINAVRAKSSGARKPDSPWNDRAGPGFGAMVAKTAKRRLQRFLPMILTRGLEHMNISQHALGMEMDTQHEEIGRHAYIDGEAHIVTEEMETPAESQWRIVQPDGSEIVLPDRDSWLARYRSGFARCTRVEQIEGVMKRNEAIHHQLAEAGETDAIADLITMKTGRTAELS